MSSASASANIFGMYGQSPRQAATLYADARNSMRQASVSSAASRRSMQSYRSSSSYDYEYVEEPQRVGVATHETTPPPPYSTRASVLPETMPTPSFASPSPSNANSPSPSSSTRAQKRRSSVMIKDLGMRILCAK
ncbi:hypothetical protein RhiJN_08137 [Ceratobasidium sp. AG-Ba]|nr:hypothetical protein RhiJN_08137 [Ceratobasidium sp. AG-Ba]QRW08895.1 hypothetical protein RhiLY_07894 [Ceratobasidium sp. AG-Ba]